MIPFSEHAAVAENNLRKTINKCRTLNHAESQLFPAFVQSYYATGAFKKRSFDNDNLNVKNTAGDDDMVS